MNDLADYLGMPPSALTVEGMNFDPAGMGRRRLTHARTLHQEQELQEVRLDERGETGGQAQGRQPS
jgi:hypothetical protein